MKPETSIYYWARMCEISQRRSDRRREKTKAWAIGILCMVALDLFVLALMLLGVINGRIGP